MDISFRYDATVLDQRRNPLYQSELFDSFDSAEKWARVRAEHGGQISLISTRLMSGDDTLLWVESVAGFIRTAGYEWQQLW